MGQKQPQGANQDRKVAPKPIKSEVKIVLVGDEGVGKTTFIKRHVTGEFDREHNPTSDVEITPLTLYTNRGEVTVKIWEKGSRHTSIGLGDADYIGSNGAIIMFDMTSIDSYNHVNKYYTSISKLCENTPICLVGNKIDDRSRRRVQEKQIVFHRQKLVGLFLVSTKTNENIEKPFEWLLRQINK